MRPALTVTTGEHVSVLVCHGREYRTRSQRLFDPLAKVHAEPQRLRLRFFSFGSTVFLTVRVCPAESLTVAVNRSESLRLRWSNRPSPFGSFSLTVLRAFALTEKVLALRLILRLRETDTGLLSRRRGGRTPRSRCCW